MYLTVTRPDITHAVNTLSQYMHHPTHIHMHASLRIVKYLKGNLDQGLLYPVTNNLQIEAFCDSDWAAFVDKRRSVTGFGKKELDGVSPIFLGILDGRKHMFMRVSISRNLMHPTLIRYVEAWFLDQFGVLHHAKQLALSQWVQSQHVCLLSSSLSLKLLLFMEIPCMIPCY
ncbi:uncharacterized protein LOC120006012 [Tripterygium wilfordii]|uniref:uncharacterized protein LOC120006012 n=1 Tax=Tripterygium wilfordii TaxID=458696 RepID=UPI0018F7ED41|nr:uncharacterized protein LOC120006012 [Tripterygium wilfordii]